KKRVISLEEFFS
nr:Chain B, cPIP motif from the DP2 large subunit of PolD [Pyrococcus abyssi]